MRMILSIPELRITGQYQTNGRVFILPVEGTGTFWNILCKEFKQLFLFNESINLGLLNS